MVSQRKASEAVNRPYVVFSVFNYAAVPDEVTRFVSYLKEEQISALSLQRERNLGWVSVKPRVSEVTAWKK